jgi:SAM-dependent methyltransferase
MVKKSKFKDHFSGNSAAYRRFRPGYPAALFAWLSARTPGHEAAWDCATGNGQAALQLAGYFALVAAGDGSLNQLRAASPHPKIAYLNAYAETPPFRPASLDLVTVAAALHWFDIPHFFAEAKTVLKPGGILAFWGYDLVRVGGEVDRLVNSFYHEILADYWPEERQLVEDGYRQVIFPFRELEVPSFRMTTAWTVGELLGYLSTWSAVKNYRAATGRDGLDLIRAELLAAFGAEERREITWPLNVRAGVNR